METGREFLIVGLLLVLVADSTTFAVGLIAAVIEIGGAVLLGAIAGGCSAG